MIVSKAELNTFLEGALYHYGEGDYYSLLLEAKEQYFACTGDLEQEGEEYEGRMGLFNEWYLFDFKSPRFSSRLIFDYLEQKGAGEEIFSAFRSVRYSLYEFGDLKNTRLGTQQVLKDLITKKKILLAPTQEKISLMRGDLFFARHIHFQGETYLLSGIRTLPTQALSLIKKQLKKVRKENLPIGDFFDRLETLKSKWIHYGFVDPLKIFVFD